MLKYLLPVVAFVFVGCQSVWIEQGLGDPKWGVIEFTDHSEDDAIDQMIDFCYPNRYKAKHISTRHIPRGVWVNSQSNTNFYQNSAYTTTNTFGTITTRATSYVHFVCEPKN